MGRQGSKGKRDEGARPESTGKEWPSEGEGVGSQGEFGQGHEGKSEETAELAIATKHRRQRRNVARGIMRDCDCAGKRMRRLGARRAVVREERRSRPERRWREGEGKAGDARR